MDRTTSFESRLGGMPAPEQIIRNGVGSMGRRLASGLLLDLTLMAVKTSRTQTAGIAITEATCTGTNSWTSSRTGAGTTIFKATVLRTTTLETLVASAAIVKTPIFEATVLRTAVVGTAFFKTAIAITAVSFTTVATAGRS